MKFLEVNNISHQFLYGAISLINVSFEAGINSPVIIFGENEAGKTSLVKIIAGLLKPQSGSVLYNNNDYLSVLPNDKSILFLNDEKMFYPKKTVIDNLRIPFKIRKLQEKQFVEAIEYAKTKIGLTDCILQKKVCKLTKEELLIVQLCKLYLREYDVILIDDIFSKFDEKTHDELLVKYKPLLNELSSKSIVIYTTSMLKDVQTLNYKTLFLNFGVVEEFGLLESIKILPKTAYLYRLIHSDYKELITQLNDDYTINIQNKIIHLEKDDLINDIYLNTNVLVMYNENNSLITNINIYDPNNEKIIYFNTII